MSMAVDTDHIGILYMARLRLAKRIGQTKEKRKRKRG